MSLVAAVLAIFGLAAHTASAANLYVDDDGAQCPAATYDSIQTAIDAAVMGDTVVVCAGKYEEGPGTEGTNGLTITKSIDIRGEGADKVTIEPTRATPTGGQIAAASPVLRDAVGNMITIAGTPEAPLTVNISGVTVSGGGDPTLLPLPPDPTPDTERFPDGEFEHGVYAEAGVVFLDAGGSFNNSRVTNVVTSERAEAETQPGGYRNGNLGWGLAKVTAATAAPSAAPVPLEVKGSRLDRYNKGGILVDGATDDSFPLTASGNPQQASVVRSTVIGRNLNSPPLDGSGGQGLLVSGTVFGQDGLRVTSGSNINVSGSDIFQNLMAGLDTYTPAARPGAAGLRFIDAAASVVNTSNLNTNAYGIVNVLADGVTGNTTVPVNAPNNFWGIDNAPGTLNTGPTVSPQTLPPAPTTGNPVPPPQPVYTSAVNGDADNTFGSTTVHFKPYRPGNEADTNGKWPTAETPAPTVDGAPTVSLGSDLATVLPGEDITLTATATDDFGVAKIEFYEGSTLIDTVTPPDDSTTWTAPATCGAPQTVEFTVFVTDSEGQQAFDELSVDMDDCPPEVALTATANPQPPLGSILLSADASDDYGLAKLEFYADGDLISTVNSPPNDQVTNAVFTPEDACGGGNEYEFEVVATDTTGHETTDTASYASDDCSPVVELEVDDNDVSPGTTVDLTATAEDDDLVNQATFFAGATQISQQPNEGAANPWIVEAQWTAPNQCGTTTELRVQVRDSGNQTAEDTVSVKTTDCPDAPPTVTLAADPASVDAGGAVTLTANANDDEGIAGLTFFEGSNQIGTATPPNNSVTWTAPDVCEGSYTLRVVARDTADQTAEATVTVTTNACPPPAEPTVRIVSPPARIGQNGTTVKANASGAAGLKQVAFFLGTRRVCVDKAAPFSCKVLPKGSEVGGSSVRAVVTDKLGRTAQDTKKTTVSKFKPRNLVVNAKRVGAKKNRMVVRGRIVLPARMTARDGCANSRVDVVARLGKRSLSNQQVTLMGCSYKAAIPAPKTKKNQRVVIRVRFPGNDSLSATTRIRKVR